MVVPMLCAGARAQGTAPTFQKTIGAGRYTLLGQDPAKGGTTTIPVLLVPVTLTVDAGPHGPAVLDAAPEAEKVLDSPLFQPFAFSSVGKAQYGDALLRSTFPGHEGWHTVLGQPTVQPIRVEVPVGYGYLLTSRKEGGAPLAVVDQDYIEHQVFRRIPRQNGRLVVVVTRNATFYADGDATICCTTGTHGVDRATGSSFVLGSYMDGAPSVVRDRDVQPLSEQMGEFFNDPLHDPEAYGYNETGTGNRVPVWRRTAEEDGGCGGPGIGSAYFLLEPTDKNHKNNIPASTPYVAGAYHLQNVALLPWYLGAWTGASAPLSFPDRQALREPAHPCAGVVAGAGQNPAPTVAPAPATPAPSGHTLIGYYNGDPQFQLTAIAPQWDTIIVAFASPVKGAPEGTLAFHPPLGTSPDQFARDVAEMKRRGKKVMLSLGGGGAFFTLNDAAQVPHFVECVSTIIKQYGFDGVDIDFESPSLVLQPGDTDFRHPKTPSVVHLIEGLRQLHDEFGPGFMISLVPEGPQLPGGYPGYGGQFGSYLPLVFGLGNDLSFVDVQDYNTPPLEGLDGEIYQSGTVDYHAAITELLLHGFAVDGDAGRFFGPVPAHRVAVGFLTGYSSPSEVQKAMRYLITGQRPQGATYRLQRASGYPPMLGAMFWTIDDDRRENYRFSNVVGPELHTLPDGSRR